MLCLVKDVAATGGSERSGMDEDDVGRFRGSCEMSSVVWMVLEMELLEQDQLMVNCNAERSRVTHCPGAVAGLRDALPAA